MEKTTSYKGKNKKQPAAKQKTAKKRKSDGPTCSMFLVELSRKLAAKKREELESPKNIIQTIIDSITNALPVKVSKSSPPKIASPPKIETVPTEATPIEAPPPPVPPPKPVPEINDVVTKEVEKPPPIEKPKFKIPKMPLVDSDISKAQKRRKMVMADADTSTIAEHDGATEITKYVSTLRKISLIAEEFNQKTAKNLKEIVDSVQEDLIKKLEEIQAEQKAQTVAQAQILKIKEDN